MITEITIKMTTKEYENMKRQQEKIKILYKAMKGMNCFEEENQWNSRKDIIRGLTEDEACYIFEAVEKIHTYCLVNN